MRHRRPETVRRLTGFSGIQDNFVDKHRLRLGIERIKPGNPQQNGRHERMHLTLKQETTKPASYNFLQQQARFDDFLDEYNHDRPHESLGMKYPGELYTPSAREYHRPDEPEYPYHDRTIRVTKCG